MTVYPTMFMDVEGVNVCYNVTECDGEKSIVIQGSVESGPYQINGAKTVRTMRITDPVLPGNVSMAFPGHCAYYFL